ncbi:MAG: GGDEF domain-containing protein [Coriobacteriales bacterium]|nr:GGDEF domain-containing protein [Coriobacteriales bacterium]
MAGDSDTPAQGERERQLADCIAELRDVVLGNPKGDPDEVAARLSAVDSDLGDLYIALYRIRGFGLALAQGDLSADLHVPGPLGGSLKGLQANLRHMTWQAEEIAAGDLSQRTMFLGEFSDAFNSMAQQLGQTLDELRKREHDLVEANAALEAAQARLREQATRDPLTGLFNRRYLDDRWRSEVARSKRNGRPLSILLADLDHFKDVNDRGGHAAGDATLVAFATLLAESIRASDVPCRVGGDEFLALMIDSTPEDAAVCAERIREEFGSVEIPGVPVDCALGASFGIAELTAEVTELDELIRIADRALYEVKGTGRNRVVIGR